MKAQQIAATAMRIADQTMTNGGGSPSPLDYAYLAIRNTAPDLDRNQAWELAQAIVMLTSDWDDLSGEEQAIMSAATEEAGLA